MKYCLLLTIFILQLSCKNNNSTTYQDIKVESFDEFKNSYPDLVLIDVRTPAEIAEGKIEGALEIDYKANGFEDKINKLDKNKDYLIYCRSGGRSSSAAKLMYKNGFKNVFNLEGGYMEWEEKMK